MLEAVEDAIADTPWWLPSAPALTLTYRVACGERGTLVNEYEVNFRDAPPEYSFTRSQCKRMRRHVLAIAAEAARGQ
jgi:hypothetical protein